MNPFNQVNLGSNFTPIRLPNYLNHAMPETARNLAQNPIRPLTPAGKKPLFAQSHHAAKDIAMHISSFGTCKNSAIDPLKWLICLINTIDRTLPEEHKVLRHSRLTEPGWLNDTSGGMHTDAFLNIL